ncbi:MAG: HEAT repeat domain-containing protein [Deltaproteobacteria bacterium]|jgi:HEAT repeat protein
MATFFCPGCWHDFAEDLVRCPNCGLVIHEFWNSKDYLEKLILALHHPEPTTPIRAAWLLGKLGDSRAVEALIDIVKETEDLYLAREAVKALGAIDTLQARCFLRTLANHPARMIRVEASATLSTKK